jgi:hypothetical protein
MESVDGILDSLRWKVWASSVEDTMSLKGCKSESDGESVLTWRPETRKTDSTIGVHRVARQATSIRDGRGEHRRSRRELAMRKLGNTRLAKLRNTGLVVITKFDLRLLVLGTIG